MGSELDFRPQLEQLDRLVLRAEGIDPGAASRSDCCGGWTGWRAAPALYKASAIQLCEG